jgi:hypothetical protein
MLFPHSHSRTQLQKRLIVGAGLIVLTLCGAGIYGYERFYRGPSESAFFGTWETIDPDLDGPVYYEFRADHTFFLHFSPLIDEDTRFPGGKWYAGGPNIYVRYDADWLGVGTRPQVWHIVDLQPNQFRVRLFSHGIIDIYKRVDLAAMSASNHTMQRTAGSPDPHIP